MEVKNISQFCEIIDLIIDDIRKTVGDKKLYVAFSGGLDSSVVAALSKMALGEEKVELVTTKFDFTYPQTLEIVKAFSSQMGLKHVFVDGSEWQKKIWKSGPACNACTRGPKLLSVKNYAKDGIVATGAEFEDTWGQQGIKVNDGIYSPISHLSRSQVQEIANLLNLKVEKIGENSRREGCILKHLLKMMTSEFHATSVYESNVQLMKIIKESSVNFSIANVKIIGPLSKNIALVNLKPLPNSEFLEKVKNAIDAIPQIDKTEIVNRPIKLKIIANPGIYNDEKARYWIENGRLKPDFALPISIEWKISKNNRLNTFQVVDYEFIS